MALPKCSGTEVSGTLDRRRMGFTSGSCELIHGYNNAFAQRHWDLVYIRRLECDMDRMLFWHCVRGTVEEVGWRSWAGDPGHHH
jgi:hypothetical protein